MFRAMIIFVLMSQNDSLVCFSYVHCINVHSSAVTKYFRLMADYIFGLFPAKPYHMPFRTLGIQLHGIIV